MPSEKSEWGLSILDGPINVTWIGGPPGKTFKKIVDKLRRLNLIVVAQISSDELSGKKGLPRKSDLVLINKDFIGHPSCEKAKELCKQKNIPWCYSGLDTISTTVPNLQRKDIIPEFIPLDVISTILSAKPKNIQREINNALDSIMMPHSLPDALGIGTTMEPTYKERMMDYEKDLKDLLLKFSKGLHKHGSSIHNLLKFVEPEKKKCSKRFLTMVDKASKTTASFSDDDVLRVSDGVNNLNNWRDKTSYDTALKRMLAMAAVGFIKRETPYEGAKMKGKSEPRISFNFSLTEQGQSYRARLEKEAIVPPPSGKVLSTSPLGVSAKKEVPVNEEPKVIVKTPDDLDSQPTKKTLSSSKSTNLQDALRIVIEVAHEEEPDMVSITIDLSSGRVQTERKKKETFIL